LVTAIVFVVLAAVATAVLMTVLVMAVLQAAVAKSGRVLDRRLRNLQAEQYVQLVSLPLIGALVGGLISTAFSIFVAHPPWHPDSRTSVGYILIMIALILAVAGPLGIHAVLANPKNFLIGARIDRLKAGDWTRDSKTDVIETIDKDRAEITKKLSSKGIWFLLGLVLAIVFDVCWLVLDDVMYGVSPGVFETILMAAAIAGGLFAWYWVRPRSLRSARAELDSYRAEAVELAPPAFRAPPSSASTVRHHSRHHDVGVAVGGLLVGAILARLGTVRSRDKRQG
jgi:hypothetical protein